MQKIYTKGVDIIKKLIAFLILLPLLSVNVSAKQGWYFIKGDPQPVCYENTPYVIREKALFMGRQGDKRVYLTFDAGYGNESVRAIARILMETNTHAAFFILPAFANTDSRLIKELDEKGYFICNHSFSHSDMTEMDFHSVKTELEKAEQHVFNKTGVKMKRFFRPPEGLVSEKLLVNCNALGYKAVFWSNAYADWDNANQKDPQWAYERIMGSLHDGMVLLLHPNSTTNAEILPRLIEDIRKAGYEFGTLEQLSQSQYGDG